MTDDSKRTLSGILFFICILVCFGGLLFWWFSDDSVTPPPLPPNPPNPGPGPNPGPEPPEPPVPNPDLVGYKKIYVRRVVDAVTYKLGWYVRSFELQTSDSTIKHSAKAEEIVRQIFDVNDYYIYVKRLETDSEDTGELLTKQELQEEEDVITGILSNIPIDVKLEDGTSLRSRLMKNLVED